MWARAHLLLIIINTSWTERRASYEFFCRGTRTLPKLNERNTRIRICGILRVTHDIGYFVPIRIYSIYTGITTVYYYNGLDDRHASAVKSKKNYKNNQPGSWQLRNTQARVHKKHISGKVGRFSVNNNYISVILI